MHTIELKDDQGREWRIHHNGDWSGDAIVSRPDRSKGAGPGAKPLEEYTLPGVLFRDACRDAVGREIISLIEQNF